MLGQIDPAHARLLGEPELEQHLVFVEAEPVLAAELLVESPGQPRVGAQERQPAGRRIATGALPAPARFLGGRCARHDALPLKYMADCGANSLRFRTRPWGAEIGRAGMRA